MGEGGYCSFVRCRSQVSLVGLLALNPMTKKFLGFIEMHIYPDREDKSSLLSHLNLKC